MAGHCAASWHAYNADQSQFKGAGVVSRYNAVVRNVTHRPDIPIAEDYNNKLVQPRLCTIDLLKLSWGYGLPIKCTT